MIIHTTFRYRIYPATEQIARLDRWDSALRSLWNCANEQRLIAYDHNRDRVKEKRIYPSYYDQCKDLTEVRRAFEWVNDVPRDVCSNLLNDLDQAWQRCFKKLSDRPRFNSRDRDQISFTNTWPKVCHIRSGYLHFPKIGIIRIVQERPLQGKPKTCTIMRDVDQWFASIVCEIEIADPIVRNEPAVGIDRGCVNTIADSDGNLMPSPAFYAKSMDKLARAQRKLKKKTKGSANHKKQQAKVAKIHRKTRRQRDHFLHVLTSSYAKSHGTVVIEKLRIGSMTSVGKGLSRSILDQGWGKFKDQLKYKMIRSGGQVVEVAPQYTSQECSACGAIDKLNRTSQSQFCCTSCNYSDHADLNAAKVIKSRWNPSVKPVEEPRSKAILRSRKKKVVLIQTSEDSTS